MRARTSAVVHRGARLGALHCETPLTLRRITAADPHTCALCLVGTAAGPLAGDDLGVHLSIDEDARAELSATGASIAQGRATGEAARVGWRADVGDGARLRADPGPLIVCEGSRVDVSVTIALGADASIEWRELVVLGRTTDVVPGRATLTWNVTRGGAPLLRQHVDLAGPRLSGWPGHTGGHRVLASTLLAGPDVEARTVVRTGIAVAQRIDPHAVLITVLGDSAAEVNRDLAALYAEFQPVLL